ncbi:xylose isomerase-like protein [Thozetella sp. PMI_491]|nr:xylose isomerase-like protein [Thozetella sp. PMI_491]
MTISYRPAILSASLGRAWLHDFDKKAQAAADAGFEGIEIFYEDLEHLAKQLSRVEQPTTEDLLIACQHIKDRLDSFNITIIGLQPFLFYEGLLDRDQHDRLIEKIKIWFQLAKVLGTDTIQIPANFLPADQLTGDMKIIVSDLRELADLGLLQVPQIRFAYESLCWSTHVDTWEKSWEVTQQVDRPNFGLCLDTFNIVGRVWADPASPTGRTPNADADLEVSMERLAKEVDLSKVFYIQVVNAERMDKPLVAGHPFHVEGNPARMNWSRNARTYMYEEDRGAYLPVETVARTLIEDLGYKGWVSMELFSRTMAEEGDKVSEEHAQRGIRAWHKFVQRLNLS